MQWLLVLFVLASTNKVILRPLSDERCLHACLGSRQTATTVR